MKTYANPNLNKHNEAAARAIEALAPLLDSIRAAHTRGDFATAKSQLVWLKLQLSLTSRCYRAKLATRARVARISKPTRVPADLLHLFCYNGGLSRFAEFIWVAEGQDYRGVRLPNDDGARGAKALADKAECAQKATFLAAAAWLSGEVDWAQHLPIAAAAA